MSSELVTEIFLLKLAPDLKRELPIVTLSGTDKQIASFVMLGDVKLNRKCAKLLMDKIRSEGLLDEFDMLVAIEAKEIVLFDLFDLIRVYFFRKELYRNATWASRKKGTTT